jgi:hypothetical protein
MAPTHTGKKGQDGRLIAALVSGARAGKAAEHAGVSLRTVRRRMKDPTFRRKLAKARDALLERALGHVAHGTVEAAVVLRKLLRDSDSKVKLGAARCILDAARALRVEVDLTERLNEIKEQLDLAKGQGAMAQRQYPNSTIP